MNYIINIIASSISIYLDLSIVNKLNESKDKIKLNIINIIIILICSNIIVLNAMFSDVLVRSFITLFVSYLYIYLITKLDYIKSFSYMIISRVILCIYEVLFSVIIAKINIIDLNMFDTRPIIKAIFSVSILILTYITCYSNLVLNISKKISDNEKLNRFILKLFSIFFVFLIVLDFRFSQTFSNKIYLGNIILVISLIIIVLIAISNYIKANKEIEKTEVLLNFMSKYEKLIDEHRISRHELLNNLLILKSIDNKNTREFNDLLNDLIDDYSNKGIKINNIYNLPSGLKGIFYYKLYGLDEYNINIKVSKKVSSFIKKLNHYDYVTLNKVVGILLDNAVEAAKDTDKKFIIIDIYDENNKIIIEINNSFKGKVNINKINEKNYSSKNNNRGLGLYILSGIIKNNKNICVEQLVHNNSHIFNSKIIINKK